MSKETNHALKMGNTEGNKLPIQGSESSLAEVAAGNKYRDSLGRFTKGNAGTLKRYTSREQLIDAVIAYFEKCEADGDPLTSTGLALGLGFTSRQMLMTYAKEPGYEEFFEVVAWARMKVEEAFEKRMVDPKCANVAGLIFALKNMGWADKTDIRMDQRTLQLTGFQFVPPPTEDNDSSNKPD